MPEHDERVLELLSRNATQVGFVSEADLKEYDLYTACEGDEVIGAALVEVLDREYALVHAIAVEERVRGQGVGSKLVTDIEQSVPSATLQAKCRTGLQANEFYRRLGWDCVRQTGDGHMNVWENR